MTEEKTLTGRGNHSNSRPAAEECKPLQPSRLRPRTLSVEAVA
jgi:hypothetical protein